MQELSYNKPAAANGFSAKETMKLLLRGHLEPSSKTTVSYHTSSGCDIKATFVQHGIFIKIINKLSVKHYNMTATEIYK